MANEVIPFGNRLQRSIDGTMFERVERYPFDYGTLRIQVVIEVCVWLAAIICTSLSVMIMKLRHSLTGKWRGKKGL